MPARAHEIAHSPDALWLGDRVCFGVCFSFATGVFVGSGIFKSGDPAARARAVVHAVTHYDDPVEIAKASEGLGEAMVGINCDELFNDPSKKHLALSEVPE